LWLNGKETVINGRGVAVLREIRKLAQDRVVHGEVVVKKEDWPHYKVRISSVNTFPTGAGLASSAAGLACLTAALAKLFCVKEEFEGQLSAIARQGSGSASRSLYGGFVRWQKGSLVDGSDSIAIQVADENYWPDLRAIIMVVSDKEKDTSSTAGMETSKETSDFLQYRADCLVDAKNGIDGRLAKMEQAYIARNFEEFGKLTMKDSNQFHATCLDTYPPIFYMNDVSKTIIRLVHIINTFYGSVKAAYTFDAGPNAVIYCLEKDAKMILAVMAKYFPSPGITADYTNDVVFYEKAKGFTLDSMQGELDKAGKVPTPNDVKYIFYTKSGPGPIQQPITESLLDPVTGDPVPPSSKHKRMNIGGKTASASSYSIPLMPALCFAALAGIIGFVCAKKF